MSELAEPTTWPELYATVRGLTLRTQTGGAESVLSEIPAVLQAARDAGAERIVHRLLYITATSNLHLNRLDDCVAACDDLAAALSDDPLDRGWRSSAASMRAIVSIIRAEQAQALAELLEAAIQLHDAPPRGPAFQWAVNGLGVGYLAVRMYELALAQYERLDDETRTGEYSISSFYGSLNAQLAHVYWGLELDRIGSLDALAHFERALELGRQSMSSMPTRQHGNWEVVQAARSGLCLAFLGQVDEAIERLEPVVERLARDERDDTILARLGLVRAYAGIDRETALLHAERALLAVGHTTDYALALGASWERARLYLDEADTAAAAEYANLLARASWEERSRLVGSAADHITAEIVRRRDRETERMLYDPATGLPNRLALVRQLSDYVAAAHASGEPVSLAFIVVAPEAPDDLIQTITATLPVDYLACSSANELAAAATSVHARALAERIQACGPEVLRHVTVGVASLQRPASVTGLIAHADEALLAARRDGGFMVNAGSSAG